MSSLVRGRRVSYPQQITRLRSSDLPTDPTSTELTSVESNGRGTHLHFARGGPASFQNPGLHASAAVNVTAQTAKARLVLCFEPVRPQGQLPLRARNRKAIIVPSAKALVGGDLDSEDGFTWNKRTRRRDEMHQRSGPLSSMAHPII
jgi:hypothetical protein